MLLGIMLARLRARSATLLSLAALSHANGLHVSRQYFKRVPAIHQAALRPLGVRMMCSSSSVEIPGYATTYTVLKPGAGTAVEKGATVTVHATGVVTESGKKFWYEDPPYLPTSTQTMLAQKTQTTCPV